MIDKHSLAIFLRGIKNGDNRYLSIGLSCTWQQALDVTDLVGTEIGYGPMTSCRYYDKTGKIHVNYHLTGQGGPDGFQSYITLTVDHGTESLAKQLDRIIRNSLCLRCNTYLGRDCHDHGVVAHCAECAEHLDIGEPAPGIVHHGVFYPDDFADLIGVRAFARIAGIPDQTARQHRRIILPQPLMHVDMGSRRFPVWNRDTANRYRSLIKEDK